MKKRITAIITAILTLAAVLVSAAAAPAGFSSADFDKMSAFLELTDGAGVKNGSRISDAYDPADPATWVGAYIDDDDETVYFGVNWGVIVDSDRRISQVDFDRLGMCGAMDLSGLDRMQALYSADGSLTSVDLSGCSALTVAAFERNSVASADLTGCSALRELYLCGNLLSELTLSSCAALVKLECDDNLLTELDLSNCPLLEELDCHGDPLTSIDLTGCSKLASFSCLGAKLTSLDLSSCPKLKLNSIEAMGNGTVSYIQGIEKNPGGLEEYRLAAEAECADGASFLGWYNASGTKLSEDPVLDLEGSSETALVAVFTGAAPAKPSISLENVPDTGKVRISWPAAAGAAKYQVWRASEKTGEYKLMKTTTACSYINTSANAGEKYWYKVRAVGADGAYGEFCAPKYRTTDLPRPVVKGTHVASTGKNKLTWEEVPGAKEYRVYRSDSKDGPFTLMKTTAGLSYVNTNAVAGNTYYYYVVAAHENSGADSAASAVKTLTCDLPRPVVTGGLTSAGKPKLTWNAVEGAKEYKVYRCDTEDGSYKLIKTTTNLSFVNTGAKSGETWYYKVAAVHEKSAANSAMSVAVCVKAK